MRFPLVTPPPPPAKKPKTADITGQFILLGCGTSVGVPALGCSCAVCQDDRPRNKRTRCSALLGLPQGNLLIDTSPDMRQQLLRENIGIIHAVIYTHEHSDHMMGFDDLRLFQFYLGHPVPIYCNHFVNKRLRKAFDYAFSDRPTTHAGAVQGVELRPIHNDPIEILGAEVIPIPLLHGPNYDVLGFRVGRVAYCTDVSEIPPASMELLQDLDVLILDALRPMPHVTHLSIDQAVEIALQLKPKQTYFTHCSCFVDYYDINPQLPAGIAIGYDGLRFPLT